MIVNLLILFFAIIYFFLAWRKLEWAVLLIIAALPAYLIRFSIFGLPMTLLELMILISFFVWFITKTNFKLFVRGKYSWQDFKENRLKREKYPWRWEIVLLLIISWVTIAIAGFTNGALGIWKAYFFEPILVFILILNLFKTNTNDANGTRMTRMDGMEKIILALAVSAFAVSVLAIYQQLTGDLIDNPLWAAAATRRVVSFFGYPNAVGLYLGPIIMILVGYITNEIFEFSNFQFSKQFLINKFSIFKTILLVATIVFSFLAIIFAKSEGAIIGLAAAIFIFGIMSGKKIRWAALIFAVVIGGTILAYAPARNLALDKIQLHDLSGQIRRQQWNETWKMLNDGHFISGAGLDNYQPTIKPYHQEGIFVYDFHDPNFHEKLVASDELKKKVWQPTEIYMYPHNILLNFWTELGLMGAILFGWIIIKYFAIVIFNFQFSIFNKLPILNSKLNNSEFKIKNYYINLGLLCAMITIIVHGLVDVPYFKNDLSAMFWIMLAMLSLIKLQTKNEKA